MIFAFLSFWGVHCFYTIQMLRQRTCVSVSDALLWPSVANARLVTKPDCWAPLIASCKIGCAKRLHCTWVKFVKACSWMMHAHRRRPLQIHHSWVQGPLMFSYVLHSVYSFACSRMMWPKNIFKKRIFYVFSTCFRYCCIVELYF